MSGLAPLGAQLLEYALESKMTDHRGYEKQAPAGSGSGHSRKGTRSKTALAKAGPVEIEPRDCEGHVHRDQEPAASPMSAWWSATASFRCAARQDWGRVPS